LFQKKFHTNKIHQTPRQQARNEQVENKKTMKKNKTTQTQINNARNEHDISNKFVPFVSKDSMCSFNL
jgi:hypothetical protein